MTDIYLIEATFEYAEQVWQFRQEVFDYDNNSESQFAGCLSLDEAASAEEWIRWCQLRTSKETCERQDLIGATNHSLDILRKV